MSKTDGAPPPPSAPGELKFKTVNATQEAEDAFDLVEHRIVERPTGVLASTMHLVKGALGAGILGGHVAYMKAGIGFGLPCNIFLGCYMTYCLHMLVYSAQIIYRRTGIARMTYPDVGEAACLLFHNTKVQKCGKFFRHWIDVCVMIDLFGSCACYELMIASQIKQLVELLYPNFVYDIRIYLLMILIPCILIVMIRHLQWLAPLSLLANIVILLVIALVIYYYSQNNPRFEGLQTFNAVPAWFECIGMIVFSMSCAGVVIPVENNMKIPHNFPKALMMGMFFIVLATASTSAFGYAAYKNKSKSPIIINFPLTTFPIIIKGLVCTMVYVTHAVNFWAPFELVFHYLKPRHKQENIVCWEYFYRGLICAIINLVAIIFPRIDPLMGFFGCFCLTNMAFIWPIWINLLVTWHRPGLGAKKWRLWRAVVLIAIGLVIWVCGTIVAVKELITEYF